MTSARSYRKPLPLKIAIQEINNGSGNQIDPQTVDAFLKVFEKTLEPQIASQETP